MNEIFTIFKVEENGAVHFTFTGEDIQESYEVSIVGDNTGLTVKVVSCIYLKQLIKNI